jgi:hypothetical protein
MGRASGRALKARPPDPFLPGPARPKPNPKSPKARGLFSGRKSAELGANEGTFSDENFFI